MASSTTTHGKRKRPNALPAAGRQGQAPDVRVEEILERIHLARNFDFRNYKRATLQRRIDRRMAERGCSSHAQYLRLLEKEPEEFDALISMMLLKVTSFFRDAEIWAELTRKIIPRLLNARRGEDVRIWCAGCATGEEAFSIAIAVADVLGQSFHTFPLKIFGTDADEAAIAYARRGIYTPEQIQGLSKGTLNRWFVRTPEGWAVRKEIRRVVVFGVNNLVSDAPISRLDLILCRNVFIYLDAELQKRVLNRFQYALRPEGVLLLGKSELIPFASKIFEPADLTRRIYRKPGHAEGSAMAAERNAHGEPGGEPWKAQPPEELVARNKLLSAMLDRVSIAIFAASLDGTVMYWNNAAARLWELSEAKVVGRKLATLGLPGMPGDLLVEKSSAVRDGRSTLEASEGVLANPAGQQGPITLRIEVMPLHDAGHMPLCLLYVAFDVSATKTLEAELRRIKEEMLTATEKLQTSNEELQSSNEELETTNEELQSANEELQTTNEELQSTNEELETTNEELQSTNAELDATNRELAHRTEEMNTLTFFQRSIIRSLTAAVVVLDRAGKVTSWNLSAERLLGLTEQEAMGQTLWTLHVPALEKGVLAQLRRALAQNRPVREENVPYKLPNGADGFACLAAIPLINRDENLGALVLLEDTTRTVRLTKENEELKGRLRAAGKDARARKHAGDGDGVPPSAPARAR